MTQKRPDQTPPAGQQKTPAAGREAGNPASDPAMTGTGPATPALPPPAGHPACDPHCVDVTGFAPEGTRIDPDITEGHPGYQESGDSEIIPPDRLAGQKTGGGKDQAG